MPLFMDFHKIESDAFTESDAYKAHLKDVAIQQAYSLTYKKFYLNLQQKTAFCLIEAPDREACIASHQEAHGVGACNVIEVSPEHEFMSFMGEGGQNEYDLALTLSGQIDSGYRTIMLVDLFDLEADRKVWVSKITKLIRGNQGNPIREPNEDLMASFVDAANAVSCAIRIEDWFESWGNKLNYIVVLATGKPVDEHSSQLFEGTKKTVRVMSRLCKGKRVCIDSSTKLAAARTMDMSRIQDLHIMVYNDNSLVELKKLDKILTSNLSNAEFKVGELSDGLGWSKARAYRKIVALTGVTANNLLSELRLAHAVKALKNSDKTIAEIAYESGYNSPTYFARVFRKRFNMSPTALRNYV